MNQIIRAYKGFTSNKFVKNFELYIGSVFMAVVISIVILNVFTRYILNFTFFWAEEVSVGCFVWTIFLGTSAAYRTKGLIGVELLVAILKPKYRNIVTFLTSIILLIISIIMLVFSYTYIINSTKITATLEISYIYINIGIVISFFLMSVYSIKFVIEAAINMYKGFKGEKKV